MKDASTFLFSYIVYSQIWLNCLLDNRHFSYITKLKKKKKENPASFVPAVEIP
jgi:hypothetical protein